MKIMRWIVSHAFTIWVASWILVVAIIGAVAMGMIWPSSKVQESTGTDYSRNNSLTLTTPQSYMRIVSNYFVIVEVCGFVAKIKIEELDSMSTDEKASLSLFLLASQWGLSSYWGNNCSIIGNFIPKRFMQKKEVPEEK